MLTLMLLATLGQNCRPGQACYRQPTVSLYTSYATAPSNYSLTDASGQVWIHSNWNYLNSFVAQKNLSSKVTRSIDEKENLVKTTIDSPVRFTSIEIHCDCDRQYCSCEPTNCRCTPEQKAAEKRVAEQIRLVEANRLETFQHEADAAQLEVVRVKTARCKAEEDNKPFTFH